MDTVCVVYIFNYHLRAALLQIALRLWSMRNSKIFISRYVAVPADENAKWIPFLPGIRYDHWIRFKFVTREYDYEKLSDFFGIM